MTRVTLDAAVVKRLLEAGSPVELCDETGAVVGTFYAKMDLSWLQPRISEEELRRRETSNERRYTTAEVLAYLKNL